MYRENNDEVVFSFVQQGKFWD